MTMGRVIMNLQPYPNLLPKHTIDAILQTLDE